MDHSRGATSSLTARTQEPPQPPTCHPHLLHNEGRDTLGSWHSSQICLGIDNEDISVGAVGDPELVAIQDIVIT